MVAMSAEMMVAMLVDGLEFLWVVLMVVMKASKMVG